MARRAHVISKVVLWLAREVARSAAHGLGGRGDPSRLRGDTTVCMGVGGGAARHPWAA